MDESGAHTSARLRSLAERWAEADAAERSNAQSYLIELTEALGVERPRPRGGGYEFEFPVRVVARDGSETVKFVDLFKGGCFVLEAKDDGGDASPELLLRKAFGQASEYAAFAPGGPPPYLMVLDVGRTLLVWDRWHGTYGGFQAAKRIDLPSLAERPDDIALLQAVWDSEGTRFVDGSCVCDHLGDLPSLPPLPRTTR
ncbi:MAG: hypothetical protein RQ745_13320 [Longimicrobiales bacterium]|nr:hypothetical protein [Longimicrobiales bacterium]